MDTSLTWKTSNGFLEANLIEENVDKGTAILIYKGNEYEVEIKSDKNGKYIRVPDHPDFFKNDIMPRLEGEVSSKYYFWIPNWNI